MDGQGRALSVHLVPAALCCMRARRLEGLTQDLLQLSLPFGRETTEGEGGDSALKGGHFYAL